MHLKYGHDGKKENSISFFAQFLHQVGHKIPETLLEEVLLLRDSFDSEGEACTKQVSLGQLLRGDNLQPVLHLVLLRTFF